MQKLEKVISDLFEYIPHAEKVNHTISKVTVGWHIEHALMVIQRSIIALIRSDPKQYKREFNWLRMLLFSVKKFPRGKSNAPDSVKPSGEEIPNYEALVAQTRKAIDKLASAEPNHFFVHPFFGKLNKQNAITLLELHTEHHIKIIKDILKYQS